LNIDWAQTLADIEDLLFPQLKLDSWERTIYLHLMRHTRLKEMPSALFAVAPLSKTLAISDIKVREVLRSLHAKGCISIADRSRQGHLIHVSLPAELSSLTRIDKRQDAIDIESLDFFNDPRCAPAILERENHRCFYCRRALTLETCELDHLVPQAERLDNSYRNIVASCHQCNKSKGATDVASFIRARYRAGLLSEEELQDRLAALASIQEGARRPNVPATSFVRGDP
jgi:5-methylcytosine-specific restriction endonuclease McrA